jgi:hypothetical protein
VKKGLVSISDKKKGQCLSRPCLDQVIFKLTLKILCAALDFSGNEKLIVTGPSLDEIMQDFLSEFLGILVAVNGCRVLNSSLNEFIFGVG